ncbi:MAG: hypothetical protein Kow0092_11640 [Deferrisomatales bacterium]
MCGTALRYWPGMDAQALGQRIREIRKALGWSAQELAERWATSRTTVYAYETGEREVPIERLDQLRRWAGLSWAELFGEGVPPAGPVDEALLAEAISLIEERCEGYPVPALLLARAVAALYCEVKETGRDPQTYVERLIGLIRP